MSKNNPTKSHVHVGLTGEYYTLAQLHHRGLTALLTVSNTKSIDILVYNEKKKKYYSVQVKTTTLKPVVAKLCSKKSQWEWVLSTKDEEQHDKTRFFCFVALGDEKTLPKFFIVPSKVVARYTKWQHKKWLKSRKKAVEETTITKFRLPMNDPKGYGDNWKVFDR